MANELTLFKSYMAQTETKNRFEEILDKNAASYMASIVNAVSGSTSLQKCNPASIMSAAFIAAALKLPIDPNLGFAYIIPYGNKAQFQMGVKGFVQLAIRTGAYKKIHVSEVYSDEIDFYNPITGELSIKKMSHWKERYKKNGAIGGYYSIFELKTGFVKDLFMSEVEMNQHAEKFSKAYQYDLKNKKKGSVWTTDFSSMAKKTVLKLLLSKYGILSTEMSDAFVADQTADGKYNDNLQSPQVEIDNEANQGEILDIEPTPETEPKKEEKEDSDGPGF